MRRSSKRKLYLRKSERRLFFFSHLRFILHRAGRRSGAFDAKASVR